MHCGLSSSKLYTSAVLEYQTGGQPAIVSCVEQCQELESLARRAVCGAKQCRALQTPGTRAAALANFFNNDPMPDGLALAVVLMRCYSPATLPCGVSDWCIVKSGPYQLYLW